MNEERKQGMAASYVRAYGGSVSDTHIHGVVSMLQSQKDINATRMRAIASASPSEYDQLDNIDSMYDHLIDTAELYLEES